MPVLAVLFLLAQVAPPTAPLKPFRSVAFSPDGRLLAVGARDEVILFDVATREEVQRLEGAAGDNEVAFLADGRLVANGWSDTNTTIFDPGRGFARERLAGWLPCAPNAGEAWSCRTLEDGLRATYGVRTRPNVLRVERWRGRAAERVRDIEDRGSADAVAFGPDGVVGVAGRLGSSLRETRLVVVDPEVQLPDGTTARRLSYEPMPLSWPGGYVRVWWRDGELRCEGPVGTRARSLAFGPDGRVMVGDESGAVVLLDDCKPVRTFEGHAAPVMGVAVAPNGGLAASVDTAGTLRWWELEARAAAPTPVDACDPLPREGTACTSPGRTCPISCRDERARCAVLVCEDGRWRYQEELPGPPPD